jgi:hypothetical protein
VCISQPNVLFDEPRSFINSMLVDDLSVLRLIKGRAIESCYFPRWWQSMCLVIVAASPRGDNKFSHMSELLHGLLVYLPSAINHLGIMLHRPPSASLERNPHPQKPTRWREGEMGNCGKGDMGANGFGSMMSASLACFCTVISLSYH